MVLPNPEELDSIEGIDLAGFMDPADEVGGDYYDVLYTDGVVKYLRKINLTFSDVRK